MTPALKWAQEFVPSASGQDQYSDLEAIRMAECLIGGKPRLDRTAEEKWQIVQERIKTGNDSKTASDMASLPSSSIAGSGELDCSESVA